MPDLKNDLKLRYERETGGQALLSEPDRLGVWASLGYVTWLENEVRRLNLKIQGARNELED